MGLRVGTNVQSLQAQRSLKNSVRSQDKALAKLSSGSRINTAGDDAAGLAISENLKSNIRGSQQASRNAGDGISMVQTAEGGMNEVSNILIRLRELSVQAASDTLGDQERKFTDLEFQQLTTEIDRIAQSTTFNGKELITGEGEQLDFQVGVQNNGDIDRVSFDPSSSSATTDSLGIAGVGVANKADAQENLSKIDSAMNSVNASRASLGALQNRLQSTINNLEVKVENLSAANSRIRDTDVAQESSALSKANILTNAGTTVLAQANVSKQAALKLL
ncbi:MAG: flagellin FliC [Bacteriovoracaceae bacterium]|nr:flagellin FliC [Bacteriovoracaceae bacterium]